MRGKAMKPETLKRACVLAGEKVFEDADTAGGPYILLPDGGRLYLLNPSELEFILPFVAERLVRKNMPADLSQEENFYWRLSDAELALKAPPYPPPEYTILSALVALGERTIEEARADL